jgi:hypothetical protein
MVRAKKRIGRPPKYGKRFALGLRVTAETKQAIEAAAKATGRTQSQQAEDMLERCRTYDALMEGMRTTVEQVTKGRIEQAFREAGYTETRSGPGGTIAWVLTASLAKHSGFKPEDEQP